MGKNAFVTGATSGIGRATAMRLAEDGWKVVGAGRRGERLRDLAVRLGSAFLPFGLDVRDREAVNRAFASLPGDFQPVDLLVNSAGFALGREAAWEASIEDWDAMVDVNVKGLYNCVRAVLPGMAERGSGHIVNIGSIAGSYPYPGGNVYSSSKAFVAMFSASLRADLHGTGVRVTNIEPGMVETEFSLVRFKGDAARAEAVYRDIVPLSAGDIADAVAYAANAPAHVDVTRIEIMPVCQSPGPSRVSAGKGRNGA
ncbi:MAG: SDR family NAD(P)-dependent oxidoreductase [Planctomycetota bacterium]|jgi:NADP-dependent 3-hydroxy acid dehydrogenase YdfG|nr:SDR family NAD(P)-dependent oxidoreductase [Planctomycetota bacterium]